jgi:hypothetical protein
MVSFMVVGWRSLSFCKIRRRNLDLLFRMRQGRCCHLVGDDADVIRMTKIYSLTNVLGEWVVEPKPPTFTNESLAGPLASFVLDPLSGNQLLPSAESLQAVMRPPMGETKKDAPPHCIWIAASKKSIRAAVNFNGERVAKVEFEEEELSSVFYVTRHGGSGGSAVGTVLMENRTQGVGGYH